MEHEEHSPKEQEIFKSVENDCDKHGREYLEQAQTLVEKFLNPEKLEQLKERQPDLFAHVMVIHYLAKACALDIHLEWERAVLEALEKPDKASEVEAALRHDSEAERFSTLKEPSNSMMRKKELERLREDQEKLVPAVEYMECITLGSYTRKGAVIITESGKELDGEMLSQIESFKKTGTPPQGSIFDRLSKVDDKAIWTRQIGLWYPGNGPVKNPLDEKHGASSAKKDTGGLKPDAKGKKPQAGPAGEKLTPKKDDGIKSKPGIDLQNCQKELFYEVVVAARGSYLLIMIRLADLSLRVDRFLKGKLAVNDIQKILELPFKGEKSTKEWLTKYQAEREDLSLSTYEEAHVGVEIQ